MTDALIGYTGFVGGNLDRQFSFDQRYNSANICDSHGRDFGTVICAGVSAVKWLANREPEQDRQRMATLLAALRRIRAERFVLISTIDVYRNPDGVDEQTPVCIDGLHAYGTHRWHLENFVREQFANHFIVRLPGLFGRGLKKNVIYDLLHGHQLENIHAQALFQFYGLDDLGRDLETVLASGVRLVNFATEPVTVREVAAEGFGMLFSHCPPGEPPRYDMRTRHGGLFGVESSYLRSRAEVLDGIRAFVARERGGMV